MQDACTWALLMARKKGLLPIGFTRLVTAVQLPSPKAAIAQTVEQQIATRLPTKRLKHRILHRMCVAGSTPARHTAERAGAVHAAARKARLLW